MKHTLAIAFALGTLTVYAADEGPSPPGDRDNFFKRAARVIGHDAKTGAKQAGEAFKKLGKDIGQGTSKAAKDIGHGVKQSADKTAKEAKQVVK